MARRVLECISFDTASATCTQQAWVEQTGFPTLSTAAALELLSAIAVCFAIAWGYKFVSRNGIRW